MSGLHCSHGFYWTQVNLGSDLWVRMSVRHWCLVPPDDQTNPNCATWWPNIQLINIQLINTSGAIWWSIVQLMQVVPSGGQICNWCKWCHLVVKFATNTSGSIWLPNLQLMQVTESISGSVVPLAMIHWTLGRWALLIDVSSSRLQVWIFPLLLLVNHYISVNNTGTDQRI